MKLKKLASLALAGALTLGLLPAFSSPALAADGDTSYTLTIPSALNVANSGWNATDGISATGSLASGKKLTVTASSANSFKLKSGNNEVDYTLATASTDTTATTSWTFDSLSSTATTKPMGIIVENYEDKPAGTYQDTVTFTASVVSASTPLDNTTTAWTAGTFAVPAGGLTYSDAITVSGNVTLVLTDGETLTLNKGISIADGVTLTVQGNGTMNVNGSNGNTSSNVAGSGTLVLTSGTLAATGGTAANVPRYGTSSNAGGVAVNGSVTVNGGILNATGGVGGSLSSYTVDARAGAGGTAISGNVTVNAGTVTATGGNGGRDAAYASGAHAGAGGVAIGGDATITAGTWTATDGSAGAKGPSEDGMPADGTVGAGGKAVAGTVTDNR